MTAQERVVSQDEHGRFNWPEGFEADPRLVREMHEVEHIIGRFRDKQGTSIDAVVGDHGICYMHRRSEILVQFEYLEPVLRLLVSMAPDAPAADPDQIPRESVIPGVVAVRLDALQLSVPEVLKRIDTEFGEGVATPNHVLTVAQNGSPGGTVGVCPATEPQPAYAGTEPFPAVSQAGDGAGVTVYVADTGLLEDCDTGHPWLNGVRRAYDANGTIQEWETLDKPNGNSGPTIPPYAGHGTFVAGLVRCMAPQADVIVSNAFNAGGSILEKDLIPDLSNALKHGVDIFNLSIAASTRNNHPLIALEKWLSRLSRQKGVACIVAAGNSGSAMPFWPGAHPGVVAVGALASDWRSRADFSNHGGWVDVYAPGRELVNAYATGTYCCYAAPYKGSKREFYGMASWSGTSFSTPIVTGLIAARMSRTGENAQEATAALLAEARSQAIPGVGAVLLPYPGGNRPLR